MSYGRPETKWQHEQSFPILTLLPAFPGDPVGPWSPLGPFKKKKKKKNTSNSVMNAYTDKWQVKKKQKNNCDKITFKPFAKCYFYVK